MSGSMVGRLRIALVALALWAACAALATPVLAQSAEMALPSIAKDRGLRSGDFLLRPSIGVIALPLNSAGYVAPATSATVAMMSITCPGCRRSSPFAAMPAGQCAIIGVAMPPS